MDRTEKIRLSANTEYGHCFRQGLFARFYEESLHWFATAIQPLKPMLERVKGGEPVIYGGLPITSFEKMLAKNLIQAVEATPYGWRWPYAEQKALPEDAPPFAVWRAGAPAEAGTRTKMPCGRNILAEVAAFNLAAHTPMQTMSAIHEWQEYLRTGFPVIPVKAGTTRE